MTRTEELLSQMYEAARTNRRERFDRLEEELLGMFGGFSGMPAEVYERYLEVDRQWPVAVEDAPRSHADSELGPRALLSVRIPELQIAFLVDEGARAGRSRAEVLSACLRLVAGDPELTRRMRDALRSGAVGAP